MATVVKKAAPKKAAVKKAAPKKAAPKKAAVKKAAPKKAAPKKAAPKKAAVKKATEKSDAEKKNSKEIKAISDEIVPSSDTSKKKTVKAVAVKKALKEASPKKSTKKYISNEINNKTTDSTKREYVKDEVDVVYELPERYNETKLTLMMRDPDWCYFYWDVSDEDTNKHKIESKKLFVKMFRLSGVDITEHKQHTEIEVGKRCGDWYVNLNSPHTYFIAELGYYSNGTFVVLARSNIVYAPRDTISNIYDDEWMVNEEAAKLLYEPFALRESLSSATIFQLVDLQRVAGSSSLLQKRNK